MNQRTARLLDLLRALREVQDMARDAYERGDHDAANVLLEEAKRALTDIISAFDPYDTTSSQS